MKPIYATFFFALLLMLWIGYDKDAQGHQAHASTAADHYYGCIVMAIPPRGEHEDWNSFEARLKAQKQSAVIIPARGEHEDWSSFETRLKAQKEAKAPIPTRTKHEDWSTFSTRVKAQKGSEVMILPRSKNEDWSSFSARVKASQEWRPGRD